jgi:hypothetical protein
MILLNAQNAMTEDQQQSKTLGAGLESTVQDAHEAPDGAESCSDATPETLVSDHGSLGRPSRTRVIRVPPPKRQSQRQSPKTETTLRFPAPEDPAENMSLYVLFSTYLSFGGLVIMSFFRDLLAALFYPDETKDIRVQDVSTGGNVYLLANWIGW